MMVLVMKSRRVASCSTRIPLAGARRLNERPRRGGIGCFDGRFTGTPNAGFGLSDGGARDYRIGWWLTSSVPNDPGFEVRLDETQRAPTSGNAPRERGAMLRAFIRWQEPEATPRVAPPGFGNTRDLAATLRRTNLIESTRGWPLPRRGSDPVRLEPRASRAEPRRASPRHPVRSTPAARTCVASALALSSAHAVGLARSAPNRCACAFARPPRHPPMARRWCSLARSADPCEGRRARRDGPRESSRRRGLGCSSARMPPVTARPAGGGGLGRAGSDRRQNRPSGQWRQGDC